jgi:hypothetical protein
MAAKHRYVRVSPEVFRWLQGKADPGDTPDSVLRKVAGLAPREQGRRSSVLRPFERKRNSSTLKQVAK